MKKSELVKDFALAFGVPVVMGLIVALLTAIVVGVSKAMRLPGGSLGMGFFTSMLFQSQYSWSMRRSHPWLLGIAGGLLGFLFFSVVALVLGY